MVYSRLRPVMAGLRRAEGCGRLRQGFVVPRDVGCMFCYDFIINKWGDALRCVRCEGRII